MAKHNLFLGQARGKIGSVVFSRLRGVQVSRAYNPSPANPRTDAQSRQRSFFASVSQYYKSFRYLIEQGQEGVQTGQPSIQNWQSRALRELAATYGSRPMLLNAKGVQWPQLIPVSLTHGSLESVDYAILGRTNSAGDRKFYLAMLFRQRFASVAALQAMTLGDFYALYPSYQRGIQLTFAALGYSVDYARTDLGNIQAQPVWCQYVIAPDADESLPFFVPTGIGEQFQINPAILSSSWGERFNPRWSMYLSEDGYAYAAVSDAAFFTDGTGGMVAGSVITSYFDGTRWARSTSPMDYADTFVRVDNSDIINTYKSAAKSNKSDLYLNQAKTQQVQPSKFEGVVYTINVAEGTTQATSAVATIDSPNASFAISPAEAGGTVAFDNIRVAVIDNAIQDNETAEVVVQDGEGEPVNVTDIVTAAGRLSFVLPSFVQFATASELRSIEIYCGDFSLNSELTIIRSNN